MSDEAQVIRGIDWKATFPFVSLFRGFRVAIHPSKLILALVALTLIFLGGHLLDAIWPQDYRAVPGELMLYGESQGSVQPANDFRAHRAEMRRLILEDHQAHLHALQKDNGSLGDIKYSISQRLSAQLSAARDAFDKLPTGDKTAQAELARDNRINQAYTSAAAEWRQSQAIKGQGLFDTFCDFQIGMLNNLVAQVRVGNWIGGDGVVDTIKQFFVFAPVWAMKYHTVFFTLFFLLFLSVWSIFGGAIARIAAVHVARDEKISIRQALRFSTSKFLSFLSAPIIPMIIVATVGLVIAAGGFIANIPFIGPIVIGVFFFLALLAGFVMTLVLLGTGGGFNLMYPTIAVEGSDSFDAISRSFSYLYARPWRMAFYSGVAILYGSICYLFVRYFLYLMLTITHYFVGLFIFTRADNMSPLWNVLWPSPSAIGRLSYDLDLWPLGPGQKLGAMLLMFWIYLAIGLLGAFTISFYFSANTIIYFLMRHEVDATELDDVYLEQSDDEFAETAPAMTMTSPAAASPGATVATSTIIAEPATGAGTTEVSPISNVASAADESTHAPPPGDAPTSAGEASA